MINILVQSDLDCADKSPVPDNMKKISSRSSRPSKHKNGNKTSHQEILSSSPQLAGRPKIEPLLIR